MAHDGVRVEDTAFRQRVQACPPMTLMGVHEEWGPLQDSGGYASVPDEVKAQIAAGAVIYGYRFWCTFPDDTEQMYAGYTEPLAPTTDLPRRLQELRTNTWYALRRTYVMTGCDRLRKGRL